MMIEAIGVAGARTKDPPSSRIGTDFLPPMERLQARLNFLLTEEIVGEKPVSSKYVEDK
jgi:hypothetical protein